jgi:hypothetical protein
VAGGEVGVALVHGQSRQCRLLSAATHGRTALRRSRVGSGDLGAEGKWGFGGSRRRVRCASSLVLL